MAHIVSCMLNTDGDQHNVISKASQLSPQGSAESLHGSSSDEKGSFTGKMNKPETRRYQLFPREKQPAQLHGSKPDSEQALLEILNHADRPADKASGLRIRLKDNPFSRRRKVSVPEIGPMTTVQETAMDSPTIPGRPPLHERSRSSPVNTWRQHPLATSVSNSHEKLDEITEGRTRIDSPVSPQCGPGQPKQPLSPRSLTPLVIPGHNGSTPRLTRQLSLNQRLRSGSNPLEPINSLPRTNDPPRIRTPLSSFTTSPASMHSTTPGSAVASSFTPPNSTPLESREHPRFKDANSLSPLESANSTSITGDQHDLPPRSGTAMSHKRNVSESGSIMDRGRPRKRVDGTPVGGVLKRTPSKRTISAERRAFETLPQGYKPAEVSQGLDPSEITYLHKQALGQAWRFDVLNSRDVEVLSTELRHLDQRADYLRRTYNSLRAGRRNLHSRICQYLKSPRVAKFTTDSMLKQEEALAELDASIDDWVDKLEHAENRRTRVRQKLLEHVAAAIAMSTTPDVTGRSECLQQAMGLRASRIIGDISTPPRSPTKTFIAAHTRSPSGSPQRVVPRVPSAIAEVPGEEAAPGMEFPNKNSSAGTESSVRRMESIRIYADSDVYALLADVENEFTKLSGERGRTPEPTSSAEVSKGLRRAQSHGQLNGYPIATVDKTPPTSPPAPEPPLKDSPSRASEYILNAAVFKPETPIAP